MSCTSSEGWSSSVLLEGLLKMGVLPPRDTPNDVPQALMQRGELQSRNEGVLHEASAIPFSAEVGAVDCKLQVPLGATWDLFRSHLQFSSGNRYSSAWVRQWMGAASASRLTSPPPYSQLAVRHGMTHPGRRLSPYTNTSFPGSPGFSGCHLVTEPERKTLGPEQLLRHTGRRTRCLTAFQ